MIKQKVHIKALVMEGKLPLLARIKYKKLLCTNMPGGWG
jgi:hypothetical protein